MKQCHSLRKNIITGSFNLQADHSSTVAQWLKSLHVSLTSSSGNSTSYPIGCLMCQGKQQKMAHTCEPLTPKWESRVELQAASFSLDQPWVLQTSGERTGKWRSFCSLPLPLSLCLWNKLISLSKTKTVWWGLAVWSQVVGFSFWRCLSA